MATAEHRKAAWKYIRKKSLFRSKILFTYKDIVFVFGIKFNSKFKAMFMKSEYMIWSIWQYLSPFFKKVQGLIEKTVKIQIFEFGFSNFSNVRKKKHCLIYIKFAVPFFEVLDYWLQYWITSVSCFLLYIESLDILVAYLQA